MAREIFNDMINWIKANKGKALGGIIGFIIAILVLTIGFFKTLFIIICIVLGIFLGSIDNKVEKIRGIIKKIFNSSNMD